MEGYLSAQMKQTKRDDLIYLAVGLGIAALVATDAFYADSQGRKMWLPSRFTFRSVYTTALLVFFVVRETFSVKATATQKFAGAVFASVGHLGIVFGFREAVGQLSAQRQNTSSLGPGEISAEERTSPLRPARGSG